ncbi:MAG: hypothetical protein WCJ18_12170, partial [Planctomycetota bacterium]
YFTLSDPSQLAAAIVRHEDCHRSAAAARRDGVEPTTWANAAACLIDLICDRLAVATPQAFDHSRRTAA